MLAKNLREWRQLVLDRDNHTCQKCGNPANIADHIVSIARNSYLALDVKNGRALCYQCHPKYGDKYKRVATLGNKFSRVINSVGPDRNIYTVTIPKTIIRSIAKAKNLDIVDFRNNHRAVVYYGDFDGAFIRFEKISKKENLDVSKEPERT